MAEDRERKAHRKNFDEPFVAEARHLVDLAMAQMLRLASDDDVARQLALLVTIHQAHRLDHEKIRRVLEAKHV